MGSTAGMVEKGHPFLYGVLSSQMRVKEFELWQNIVPPDVILTGHRTF